MAALQCDICGGKLMGRPGGIFECDSCGMQYDTAWAKEKIQEIKGTVKVEGTVAVQGTVRVEGPVQIKGGVNIESLLQRGNLALEDGKWEEAKKFFDSVLNMDAKCADAHWGILCAKYEQLDLSGLLKKTYETIREDKDYQRALNLSDDEIKNRSASREQEFQKSLSDAKVRLERKRLELESARKRIRPARGLLDMSEKIIFGVMIDGTVRMCGIPGYYEQKIVKEVPSWRDICAICTVPNEHTLFGLKYDGTVIAAGKEKLVEAVSKWTDIASIYSAPWHLVGLKKDGTVVISGSHFYYKHQGPAVSEWRNIVDIYTDLKHIYGIQADGRVVAASSEYEEQNEATSWCDIVGMGKDMYGIVGLKADGTITTEGYGNVKVWEDVVALFHDGGASIYGLRKDGTVLHRHDEFQECRDGVAITVGYFRKLLLRADGTVDIFWPITTTEPDEIQMRLKMNAVRSWKLFTHIDTLEQERQEARDQLRQAEARRAEAARRAAEEAQKCREEKKAALEEEKDRLTGELSALKGLFSGKRRREIIDRLAAIEAEQKGLK